MKNRVRRRRAKEKERAAAAEVEHRPAREAERRPAREAEHRPARDVSKSAQELLACGSVHPQAGLHLVASEETSGVERRRPLLDGGPEGVRAAPGPTVDAVPPPHGQLLLVRLKLKRDVEAIRALAAQALGFHTAAIAAKVTGTLTAIIHKVSAMQNDLDVLHQIVQEGSALYTDLQSVKAWLRSTEHTAPEHEYKCLV